MTANTNSHPYKITKLPEGFSKLAIAAWKVLDDRELFEIDGTLVFTDDIECHLNSAPRGSFCVDEFPSFAAFEKWLLAAADGWRKNDYGSPMRAALDQFNDPA